MSDALAIRTVNEAISVAAELEGSSLVPRYIRSKQDALFILMTGAELGLGPAASFRGLFSIGGNVGMKYQLVGARLRQFGWRIKWLTESTDEKRATVVLTNGDEEHRETYTIEQAARAGLTTNDQWKKRPERMLRARALTGAADAVDGRIRMGLYSEDEVDEIVASRPPAPAPVVREVAPVKRAPEPAADEEVSDGEIVCGADPAAAEASCAAPAAMTDCATAEELQAWCGVYGARIAAAGRVARVEAYAEGIGVAVEDVRRWCGVEEVAQ